MQDFLVVKKCSDFFQNAIKNPFNARNFTGFSNLSNFRGYFSKSLKKLLCKLGFSRGWTTIQFFL